jgi:hypothetical protein
VIRQDLEHKKGWSKKGESTRSVLIFASGDRSHGVGDAQSGLSELTSLLSAAESAVLPMLVFAMLLGISNSDAGKSDFTSPTGTRRNPSGACSDIAIFSGVSTWELPQSLTAARTLT